MTNEKSAIKTKQETNIFQGSMACEEWTIKKIKQGIKNSKVEWQVQEFCKQTLNWLWNCSWLSKVEGWWLFYFYFFNHICVYVFSFFGLFTFLLEPNNLNFKLETFFYCMVGIYHQFYCNKLIVGSRMHLYLLPWVLFWVNI